jgi:peroxin-1
MLMMPQILRAVALKLPLTPSASEYLAEMARETEGFTGADLQALIYNAHLEVVHESIADSEAKKKADASNSSGAQEGKLEFVVFGGPADEDTTMTKAEKDILERTVAILRLTKYQ